MASPCKIPNKILLFLCFSLLSVHVHAEPHFISAICSTIKGTGNYTNNSLYETNLHLVLSNLSTQASSSSFYNTTAGEGIDKVYALYYCRGDTATQDCSDCIQAAAKTIITECPVEKESIAWYDECTLRYANRSFFSAEEEFPNDWHWSKRNVSNPDQFIPKLGETMNSVIEQATSTGFAKGQGNVTVFQTVYCLAQCSPDIIGSNCNRCLRAALKDIPTCCGSGSNWAKINYPSCRLMYDLVPIGTSDSTSPIDSANGSRGASPPQTSEPKAREPRKGKGAKFYTIIIAAPVAAALLILTGIGACLILAQTILAPFKNFQSCSTTLRAKLNRNFHALHPTIPKIKISL